MNKHLYLDELRAKLATVDPPMLEAIIKQYEGIFQDGLNNNKEETQIIAEIGSTDFVSDYYIKELAAREEAQKQTVNVDQNGVRSYQAKDPKDTIDAKPAGVNIIRGIFVGFGLLLFNLIIVLGPYLAVWGVILAFFVTGLALSVSGVAFALASFISLPFATTVPVALLSHPVLLIALCAILICLGLIFMLINLYVGKYLGIWTVQYMKWNFSVIRGEDHV